MKNTNTKKISYDEWQMIGKYNHARPWLRSLCTYTLTKESDTRYRRDQYIPMWFFALAFIPVCVIQAVWCMWDGGLKEFECPVRHLGSDCLWSYDYNGLLEELFKK